MIDQDMVREIYATAQDRFFVNNMALALANREPGDALKVEGGKKYHKPIIGFAQMEKYTPLTATTNTSVVSTEDEYLEVDRNNHAESIHINIDDTEEAQLRDQNLAATYGEQLGNAMKDSVEKRWISAIESIYSLGSNTAIDFTATGAALDTAEEGFALVDVADVANSLQRVWIVGPREFRRIEREAAARGTALGDTVFINGFPARSFMGAALVVSNNLPWRGTLDLTTQPTSSDTITVAGATFRFVSSLTGGEPGDVLLGANAGAARNNFFAALTGGAGAGTTYIPHRLTEQRYLQLNRRIAVDGAVGATTDLTGFGDIIVSSDLTASGEGFTAEEKDTFFTVVGATDLALQLDDGLEVSRPKPMSGEAHFTRISGVTLHNSKTFTDGKYMNVTATIDASKY